MLNIVTNILHVAELKKTKCSISKQEKWMKGFQKLLQKTMNSA